jgi:hypothetical protein
MIMNIERSGVCWSKEFGVFFFDVTLMGFS